MGAESLRINGHRIVLVSKMSNRIDSPLRVMRVYGSLTPRNTSTLGRLLALFTVTLSDIFAF